MNTSPPYHPDWLISFWYGTPGLKLLNPHITLTVLAVVFIATYFIRKAQKTPSAQDTSEIMFQSLIKQKQTIEANITALRAESADSPKLKEYEQLLEKVNKDLLKYTL